MPFGAFEPIRRGDQSGPPGRKREKPTWRWGFFRPRKILENFCSRRLTLGAWFIYITPHWGTPVLRRRCLCAKFKDVIG